MESTYQQTCNGHLRSEAQKPQAKTPHGRDEHVTIEEIPKLAADSTGCKGTIISLRFFDDFIFLAKFSVQVNLYFPLWATTP
ncbi:MAG: hypothetical protein HQK53_11755 [Oligoflexia bacterium]|nr:hypothetical protein [Oligoflexia bacterium]